MKIIQTIPSSVNLFRSGAEITRTATAELSKGTETLMIKGISTRANLNTARLYCGKGITMSNMRFETDSDDTEVKEIEGKLEALRQENAARELQKSLWETNGDFSSRTSVSASEIESYISALPQRLKEIQEASFVCTKEIGELEKKLEDANQRKTRPVMIAEISAEADGSYPLEVHYVENGAGWSPVYEIHTDGQGPLELLLRASMNQKSGEDWENIKVRLFTGNPSGNNTLPVMNTTFLDIQDPYRPQPRRQMAGMAMMGSAKAMAMNDMVMEDAAPMMAMMETPEPEETEDLTMTEFELDALQNIRSEEAESMADLTKTILDAEYEVCTCPRIDASAYLTAKVKTAELPNLLANSAKVYLSGMYMGTVILNQDYSEEFETISLGKEERIRISTKEVSKKTSKTLLKAQNVTEYVYETTIMNTLSREVTVLVKDQIPVSANKAVTVDLIKADGYQKEDETGFLKQTVTIPAGGSKVLTLSYKVSWPKDKVLKESASAGYPKFCPECGSVLSSRTCSTCGWTAQ
ncbi:MAG: mucoidy inhibitor MuiA family protein [Solobacterium sp.]|nr:mucoidy inhibitor MuiA family protein [Solobacterium sp.]